MCLLPRVAVGCDQQRPRPVRHHSEEAEELLEAVARKDRCETDHKHVNDIFIRRLRFLRTVSLSLLG
jgi:hypothetical protein